MPVIKDLFDASAVGAGVVQDLFTEQQPDIKTPLSIPQQPGNRIVEDLFPKPSPTKLLRAPRTPVSSGTTQDFQTISPETISPLPNLIKGLRTAPKPILADTLRAGVTEGLKPKKVEPSFAEVAKKRFKKGEFVVEQGLIGEKIKSGEIQSEEGLRSIENLQKELPEEFEGLGLPKRMVGGTAEFLPFMIKGFQESLKKGTAGAIGGAAAAAAGGALPAVPATTLAGFSVGATFGVVDFTRKIEGGNAFIEMIQSGIDPKVAKPVSEAVGVANGFIEASQLGTIAKRLPGGSIFFKKKIQDAILKNPTIRGKLLALSLDLAGATGVEITQEVAQEAVTLSGEALAGVIEVVSKDEKYKGPSSQDALDRMGGVLKASAEGFPLLMLPGATFQTVSTFSKESSGQDTKSITVTPDQLKEIEKGKIPEDLKKEIARVKPEFVVLAAEEKEEVITKEVKPSKVVPKLFKEEGLEPVEPKKLVVPVKKPAVPVKKLDLERKLRRVPREVPAVIAPAKLQEAVKEIEDTSKLLEEKEKSELSIELSELAKTPEVNLLVAVKDIGGIAPTLAGKLKEELAAIPKSLKGKVPLDEAVERLKQFGHEFADGEELRQAIIEEARQPIDKADKAQLRNILSRIRKNQKAIVKVQAIIQQISQRQVPAGKVKQIVRASTAQLKVSDLISADAALAEVLRKEQQISRKAFVFGKVTGVEVQKIQTRSVKARERERRAVREEISGIVKRINKLPTQNLPIEYKEKIEEIKSGFDFGRRTQKTLARRESMKIFIQQQEEQGVEINIPQESLDLLEKVTLNDITLQELRDIDEVIARLVHLGRTKNRIFTDIKNHNFEAALDDMINTITKGKGITEKSAIIRTLEDNPNIADKSLEGLKSYIAMHLRPEVMVNGLDGFEEGINTQAIWDPSLAAEGDKLREQARTLEKIQKILKPMDVNKTLGKKFTVGRFKNMTKDQALFIYANSFNAGNMSHLIGSGITQDDLIEVERFLTDEEKSMARDIIKFYDEDQYQKLNDIHRDLEGVNLPKEENYFPIDRLEDISYQKELQLDILQRAAVRRAGVVKGFTKSRVHSTKAFSDFSFIGTIFRNWQKIEHYKAFAKSVRDVNKFVTNKKFKRAVEENFGKRYYFELDKWIKDVAFNGDKAPMQAIDQISRFIRTNYATAVLGLNFVTMMKQPVSYFQGAEFMGKRAAMRGTVKFIGNPIKWIEFSKNKSVFMKNRSFRQERELREIQARRGKTALLKTGKVQRGREFVMIPILAADRATVTSLWIGAYFDQISLGKTEADAVKWADKVIRRTQPQGSIINLPGVFRGSEIQKLYTIFKNQLNQNFNLIFELYQKTGKGKMSINKFIQGNIMLWLAPAFAIGFISRRRTPDKKEFFWDTLGQLTGTFIIFSSFVQSMQSGFLQSGTPLDQLVEDAVKVGSAKKTSSKAKAAADVIGKLTGFPVVFTRRVLKGEPFGKLSPKKRKSKIKFGGISGL